LQEQPLCFRLTEEVAFRLTLLAGLLPRPNLLAGFPSGIL